MTPVRAAIDGPAVAALAAIVVFVLAGQVAVADPVLSYAIALFGFSCWMAWFVLSAVRWLTVGP